MRPKTALASMLGLLLAGSVSSSMAQKAPAASPGAPSVQDAPPPRPPAGAAHDGPGGPGGPGGMGHHDFGGPGGGTIGDLLDLEHLYVLSGRAKELPALYNDVLAKSQDPHVRDFVYHQLAHLQAQPTNVDEAITTLRKALDESLADEAKMKAEHEKWHDHPGNKMPPPPVGN